MKPVRIANGITGVAVGCLIVVGLTFFAVTAIATGYIKEKLKDWP